MLSVERRATIVRLAEERGVVNIVDLAVTFALCEATIRRDIDILAKAGALQRVSGGALPLRRADSPTATPPLGRRPAGPGPLASAVLQLLQPGQTVVLDGGSVLVEVARYLPGDLELTVVTNSLVVAVELASRPLVAAQVVGGELAHHSRLLVGAEAVEAMRAVSADLCLLGMVSLSAGAGLTCASAEEAEVRRAMVEEAGRVVVVAEEGVVGRVEAVRVVGVEAVDVVVTDAAEVEWMRGMGVEVYCV